MPYLSAGFGFLAMATNGFDARDVPLGGRGQSHLVFPPVLGHAAPQAYETMKAGPISQCSAWASHGHYAFRKSAPEHHGSKQHESPSRSEPLLVTAVTAAMRHT